MLIERISGETLHGIGRRHGISHVAARNVIIREGRRHVDQIELQLMVAAKQDRAFGLAIPAQLQDDRAVALSYLAWIVRELRDRGVEIEVETKPTPDGLLVVLTDVVTYRQAREADMRRQSR